MNDHGSAPLSGIRVVDRSDGYGVYAGRLLAGLGAVVIRTFGSTTSEPLLAPTAVIEGETISLFDEWANAGKIAASDLDDDLLAGADVLLSAADGPAPGALNEQHPRLVHVVITPFGWGLSPEWGPVDDLLVLGLGGLLHLGGYPDTGPVGAFGNQSMIASGIFGAIAALVGLIQRQESNSGSSSDVSAQEAIAQALEDSLPTYALTGVVRGPQGEEAREAGTGVYKCSDGYVSMVAGRLGTARAWAALTEWLASGGGDGTELLDEPWNEFAYRQTPAANRRFREIFEDFASSKSKEELYEEGQRRGIAISPVSDVGDLLSNQQLDARDFFVEATYPNLGAKISVPGSPFRLSGFTPPVLGGLAPAPSVGSEG